MKKGLLFIVFLMSASVGIGQMVETFSNIGPYGGYQTETWTGDNAFGTWTATDARTDQTINGKAITIKNGTLTSPSITGGIGNLTVTTQRKFSGGSGNMTITVNGTSVGSVPYDGTEQTSTISNINVSGNITIVIDATNSDRIAIDDLTWTAFGGAPGPGITNISHTPVTVDNTNTVSVSADVVDADGVAGVTLYWGTTSGSLTNSINMSLAGGDTYTTDSDIPAQVAGTTVYYEVYALDNNVDETTSPEQSYTVQTPATPVVGFSTISSSVSEGNSGTSVHNVAVSMDLAPSSDADVDIVSFEDTATENDDYVGVSTTLTFPAAGSYPMTQNVMVTINGDTDVEGNEDFNLFLDMTSGSSGLANVGTNQHTVTISNDDVPSIGDVRINEVDSSPAEDEFVELFGIPNFSLDGLVLVYFNGNATSNGSYESFDLDGYSLDANGYFILGKSTSVSPAPEYTTSASIQDGTDAIGLYYANASDFSSGTPPTTVNLIDAIVYTSGDPDDSSLRFALDFTAANGHADEPIDEAVHGDRANHSVQRGSWFVAPRTPRGVNQPLPIHLTTFTATKKAQTTYLQWQTATEINNDYMAIERSSNGRDFEEITRVKGAGTTYEAQSYEYTDAAPLAGVNYYRLRQVDFDGKATLHNTVSVTFDKGEGVVRIIPTEAASEVMVYLPEQLRQTAQLRVYDLTGQLWMNQTLNRGTQERQLDVSALPQGHYFLQLIDGNAVETVRFNKI